jgi:hypothetical protein
MDKAQARLEDLEELVSGRPGEFGSVLRPLVKG